MTANQEFTALHHGDRPFVLPNAWDVGSGLFLADAGFPAVGTTSLGMNAAAGLPDGAEAGLDAAVDLGCTLARRLRVPGWPPGGSRSGRAGAGLGGREPVGRG